MDVLGLQMGKRGVGVGKAIAAASWEMLVLLSEGREQ